MADDLKSGIIEILGHLSVFDPDDKFTIPEKLKEMGLRVSRPQEVEGVFTQLGLRYIEDRFLFFFKLKIASLKAKVEGKKGADLAVEVGTHLIENGDEFAASLGAAIDSWEVVTPRELLISWDKIISTKDKDALYYRFLWEVGKIVSQMDKPYPMHVKNETMRQEFLAQIYKGEPRLPDVFGHDELDATLRLIGKHFTMSKIISIPEIGRIAQDIKPLLPDPAKFSTAKVKPGRPATAAAATPRAASTGTQDFSFKANIAPVAMGEAYVPSELPDFMNDESLSADDPVLSGLMDQLKGGAPEAKPVPEVNIGSGVNAILENIARMEVELENTKAFLAYEQSQSAIRDQIMTHMSQRLQEMRAKAAEFQERYNQQLQLRQETEGRLAGLTETNNVLQGQHATFVEEVDTIVDAFSVAVRGSISKQRG